MDGAGEATAGASGDPVVMGTRERLSYAAERLRQAVASWPDDRVVCATAAVARLEAAVQALVADDPQESSSVLEVYLLTGVAAQLEMPGETLIRAVSRHRDNTADPYPAPAAAVVGTGGPRRAKDAWLPEQMRDWLLWRGNHSR